MMKEWAVDATVTKGVRCESEGQLTGKLDQPFNTTPGYDIKSTIGDFNAKIRNHRKREKPYENGRKLIELENNGKGNANYQNLLAA
ncbi:hypothetical protein Trydic_g836 [Trypoxylus dichotomus]